MKEEIEQLKTLLKKFDTEIENRLYIETTDIEEFEKSMRPITDEINFPESHIEQMKKKFLHKTSDENTKLFYENLSTIKFLLVATLENINRINRRRKSIIENLRTTSSDLTPNEEFRSLIKKGILKTDQQIWGRFKKQSFSGHLTENGFFELNINKINILFSDFKYPILYAWGKIIPNDGWGCWTAIDNRTGDTKSLNYFRKQLQKIG